MTESKRQSGGQMNNHKIDHQCKLNKMADKLTYEGIMCHHRDYLPINERPEHTVDRKTLKEFICGTLLIHDPHIVNGWIDELIGLGWFTHNPTSEKTYHGYIKPTNDSRYFIHWEQIAHTHTHIGDYSDANYEPSSKQQSGSKQDNIA